MINIISKAYCRHYQSGPKKVVDNLVKGLTKIGYPFVVNKELQACTRLWIHDDLEAVRAAVQLPEQFKVVIGPNLVVLPRNLPEGLDVSRFVYIHPSEWAKKFWQDCGYIHPIVAWPTGIDTNEFAPTSEKRDLVLVYFKQRFPAELVEVTGLLEQKKIAYRTILYPQYREQEYKKALQRARYVIWLGRQESQGIALQEALACNVPILLCDVTRMGQWQASPREMAFFNDTESRHWATAAEYFDDTCGIRITDLAQLDHALIQMEKRLPAFQPRTYILNNLSVEKQARDFVNIYNTYFGLTFEGGVQEQILAQGNWVNRSIKNRVIFLMKDVVKTVLRFAKQRQYI